MKLSLHKTKGDHQNIFYNVGTLARVLFFLIINFILHNKTIITFFHYYFSCCGGKSTWDLLWLKVLSLPWSVFSLSYLLDQAICKTQILERKLSGNSYFHLLVPVKDIFYRLTPRTGFEPQTSCAMEKRPRLLGHHGTPDHQNIWNLCS